MNLSKLIKEEFNNIQCENIFDMNEIYKQYVEFSMPLYSIINKWRTARLEYIKPDQYIYNIARGFGGLSYTDALSSTQQEVIDKYAQDMSNGDKFPVIYYTHNKSGQEGRHRAMASKKLGCEYIPVIKFMDLDKDEIYGMLMQFDGDSFDEVNNYFKEEGFKEGITQKCFNDLERYIENNRR